jgi:fused signal recognition particle receptor
MFRRLFRGSRDEEIKQGEAEREQASASDELLPSLLDEPVPPAVDDPPTASTPPVASTAPAEAAPMPASDEPAAQPEPAAEPAKYAPLFSRVDELERMLYPQQQPAPEQGFSLRRIFAGEERSVEEIQREERKTGEAVQKTRAGFFGRIAEMFNADDPITEELWEELEELLIMADVGVETTVGVIERVRRKAERENLTRASQVRAIIKQELIKLLQVDTRAYIKRSSRPYIILVIGVNGAGKTTLIAKIANRYKNEVGQSVLLAAADTFRAAAVEQLETWAGRVGVPLIKQGPGADPGAVAFDAVEAAHARDTDVVIIDTAGRLQSKYNLMQELQKIRNVVRRRVEWAPHEVLLVIDATTGQNGLMQAKAFMEAAEVTHLALTKLDGTAKGGIAFAMVQQIKRPILYIGTGEKLSDLALFDAEAFVDALFEQEVPA